LKCFPLPTPLLDQRLAGCQAGEALLYGAVPSIFDATVSPTIKDDAIKLQ
jgi:hypothetical protein